MVAKDTAANTVYVAHDPAAAAPAAVALVDGNWLEPAAPDVLYEQPLLVRVRHGDRPRPCRLGAAAGGNGAAPALRFEQPLPGIAQRASSPCCTAEPAASCATAPA